MPNPYAALGPDNFWKMAVAQQPRGDEGRTVIHARAGKRFRIPHDSRVATAGSCFAQNVARHLRRRGVVRFIETEALQPGDPVFSGRYGNIYTARQMLQLFDESMEGVPDPDCAIRRHDGRFVDIHRPFIEKDGFASAGEVLAARAAHLAAIRPAFTRCDLFVFTLGLTEAWQSGDGKRVFPVCPGIYSDDEDRPFSFVNFGFSETIADMKAFAERLFAANKAVKLLLTVSPVPLTATATPDHVLTATMLSKSVLRAVAGELAERDPRIFYFPSYEMIAEPFSPGTAYDANLRTVSAEAIDGVMAAFEADYLVADETAAAAPAQAPAAVSKDRLSGDAPDDDVVCDDVKIEQSIGF